MEKRIILAAQAPSRFEMRGFSPPFEIKELE
jgi:hypothetical protein